MAAKYMQNKKNVFLIIWKIIAHYYNNGLEEDNIYIYICILLIL